MNEPLWRRALCWSAVVTFFTAPLVIFTLKVVAVQQSWDLAYRWGEFKGIGAFYQTITALVFGLAGLRSFDRAWEIRHNGNNGRKEQVPTSDGRTEPDKKS